MGPIVAFTMAGLLFIYSRSSIRAAKRNAERHRVADGGQISWYVNPVQLVFRMRIFDLHLLVEVIKILFENWSLRSSSLIVETFCFRFNESQRRHGALKKPGETDFHTKLVVDTRDESKIVDVAGKGNKILEEKQGLRTKKHDRREHDA